MKWVEEKGFMDKEDLEMFANMYYRGEDFDKISESRLKEGGLPPGPAMRLFNAIQELIRSKDERGHIIYLLSAVASFHSCFCLFVVACCFFFF